MVRRRTQNGDLRRRLVVVLALAGYLTGTIGFPMPQLRSTPATGQATAVRQHACGCVEVVTVAPVGCCCTKSSAAPACCSDAPPVPPAAVEEPVVPAGFTWIDSLSARQCRGLGTSWLTVELTVPPPVQVAWNYCWAVDSWLPDESSTPISGSLLPPIPPPR